MAKTGLDHRPKIDRLLALHVDLLDIPDSVPAVKICLSKAQTELKALTKTALADRKTFLQSKQGRTGQERS
jgi:hypothetical protein